MEEIPHFQSTIVTKSTSKNFDFASLSNTPKKSRSSKKKSVKPLDGPFCSPFDLYDFNADESSSKENIKDICKKKSKSLWLKCN